MKLDFFRVIPFVMESISIISMIDADGDGVINGQEKLGVVKREIAALLRYFPDIAEKLKLEPAKTEKFVNALVEAFNLIVK